MRFKALIFGVLVAAATGPACLGFAQDKAPQDMAPQNMAPQDKALQDKALQDKAPQNETAQQTPPEQSAVDPKAVQSARLLIEEALRLSHISEIFDALRRTVSEVYIPTMRALIQGDFPGAPEADAVSASELAKILTFLDYARKAGDELNAVLSENREAMISDFSRQLAKSMDASDLGAARGLFDLPATKKGLDAFYAMSKLVTGFSYEDSKTFSKFSAWASTLNLDLSQVLPDARRDGSKSVPSGAKIKKAKALVTDLMKMSHFEELVSDIQTFARDVYAETVPLGDEERQKLRQDIDQYEFMVTIQKGVVVALAPSALASTLTDDQLETLGQYLHSPAFLKVFELLRNAVKSVTALSKDDIIGAEKAFKDIEQKSKILTPEARENREAQSTAFNALVDQWAEKLKNRLSPETRQGLEQSLSELQLHESPM